MTSEFDSGIESPLGAECESALGQSLALVPAITAADSPVANGDTGKTVTGAGFGPGQGQGKLELGDANTYAGSGTLEEQTVTAWGDDEITYTAVRGVLPLGSVYAYVQSDTGHRSGGREITLEGAFTGDYYCCGAGGVFVYNEGTGAWDELGSLGGSPRSLAIHDGVLYCGNGAGVHRYDQNADTWEQVGTSTEDFITLFSLTAGLFGINTDGDTYSIDVVNETYTLEGSPSSTDTIYYAPVVGDKAHYVGNWSSYGGVSVNNGIIFDGASFSALDDAGKQVASNAASILIGPTGAIEAVQVEDKSGFPVPRGFGRWSGSAWSYLGATEGNWGTGALHLSYLGGFYFDLQGRKSEGDAPWDTGGLSISGATINRARSHDTGVYAALNSNDSVHGTTLIKFGTTADTDGEAFGTSPPNPARDILISDTNAEDLWSAPGLSITAPTSDVIFTTAETVSFTGTATDDDGTDIASDIEWSSNVDGSIGSGSSVNTSTLTAGSHTITASVTDSKGFTTTDTVDIYVGIEITSIDPTSGSEDGGETITVTGNGFESGVSVTFDGNAATNVTVNSATELVCDTPSGSGTVDVVVSNGTDSDTLANSYTYVASISVDSISPTSGSTAGGTAVTITGSGFNANCTVEFQENLPPFNLETADNIVIDSGTQISCDTPAWSHGAGDVNVKVRNTVTDVSDQLNNGFTYT